jgi:hypothetical protein
MLGEMSMKRKIISRFALCFFLFWSAVMFAQFTPEEIAQREEIEVFLKEAKIVEHEKIGEGVTKPRRLYLQMEDKEMSGCWKNPEGFRGGALEGWQYEIAAYEVDKLLGLKMVPPTIARAFRLRRGSLQYWITSEMSELDRYRQELDIPEENLEAWSKAKYLMRAFDCIIGNDDRTKQNTRYTKDWRIILIDHSRAFRSTERWTQGLPYGLNGFKEQRPIRILPRAFVDKVRSLTYKKIKEAVGMHLTDSEIKAVLARKDLLVKEIDGMIAEKGADKVLY